ncbi:hypothetical protein T484DRAFT_1876201, partial [Baffinella frigidus]
WLQPSRRFAPTVRRSKLSSPRPTHIPARPRSNLRRLGALWSRANQSTFRRSSRRRPSPFAERAWRLSCLPRGHADPTRPPESSPPSLPSGEAPQARPGSPTPCAPSPQDPGRCVRTRGETVSADVGRSLGRERERARWRAHDHAPPLRLSSRSHGACRGLCSAISK